MANSIIQSYLASLAGTAAGSSMFGAIGAAAGIGTYRQKYDRSFLRYAPRRGVSRQVAEAGGVEAELGYEPSDGDDTSFPQPTAGDRIEDKNNDGIPDNINLVSGTGDTFRTLDVQPGTFSQLAERYDKEEEIRKEEALSKEFSVAGVTSKLKSLVAKEAGRAVGAPPTRFDILTGRDVIAGGFKTGSPIIDAAQALGQQAFEKFTLPELEEAAARSALGEEGYGIFTLGGGKAIGMTPEGIVGDPTNFLSRTGRTQEQLENELRDKMSQGQGRGFLGDMYTAYTTSPIRPGTPTADIKGRAMYEQYVLDSSLSDELKSDMLGGADLTPTFDYTFQYEDGTYGSGSTTGFAGTVRHDASTGEVIQDNRPTGSYYDEYEYSSGSDDNDNSPSTSSSSSSGSSGGWSSSPSSGDDWSSFIAKGGEVTRRRDMANGGDLLQKTGFVSGSPDTFTEEETVADTEYRKLREGSYVLNAPTVEELQNAGILPRGVDNSKNTAKIKAGKGGLIDVALSKGEVVLEPEEAQELGYDFLDSINNRGKSEVDRRQASKGGRVGYNYGGIPGSVNPGRRGFLGMPMPEVDVLGPPTIINPGTEKSFKDMGMQAVPAGKSGLSPFESMTAGLLELLEGNPSKAYVPKKTGRDRSGVSIGLGFDVGQYSVSDLERMGLNSSIISKLTPYVGKKGDEARAILAAEPLELSKEELSDLNTTVLRRKMESFDEYFPDYANLPEADKAVLISADWIGGLRKTESNPKGRYQTFMNEYGKANNMRRAIRVGLLNRIKDKGDPEYNRAAKALDWYSQQQTQRMSVPTPRPN